MFLLLAGRVIQVLLTVAQIRLATTVLEPVQYGTWVLLQTVAGLFILFGISPFGLYLNRHVIDWESEGILPKAFKGYSTYLFLFSIAMTVISCLLIALKLLNFSIESMWVVSGLICLLMFAQTFHQTWIPTLNFLGNRKGFVLGSSVGVLLSILTAAALHYLGFQGVVPWVLSVAFGYIVSTFIFIPRNWYFPWDNGGRTFFKHLDFKNVLAFSGPLFLTTAFGWGHTQGYRLLVENKLGLNEFGKFAAGYTVVAGLYGALESVVASFYQANYFKNINSDKEVDHSAELRKIWKASLYPYALAGAFLYLAGPLLSSIFLAKDFSQDVGWLSMVIFSEGARLLFNLMSINFHGKKSTRVLILPQFLGVTISLGYLYFTESLSFTDVIFALSLGYILACIILLLNDLKTFISSSLIQNGALVILVAVIYVLIGKLAGNYIQGYSLLAVLSFIGFVFMLPYLKQHMKDGNE